MIFSVNAFQKKIICGKIFPVGKMDVAFWRFFVPKTKLAPNIISKQILEF
jgi:hypothetical protein